MDRQPNKDSTWARYAGLGQLGLEMVVPIPVGIYLDYQFETAPWITIAGAVVGLTGGIGHLVYGLRSPAAHQGDKEEES